MQIVKSKEFWSGVLLLAFAAAFFGMTANSRMGTAADMGPAFFPRVVACLLAAVGLINLIRAAAASAPSVDSLEFRPLLVILAATIAFGLLLERAGLLIAIFVATLIAVYARPSPGILEGVVLATVLMFGSCVVFVWGLGTQLPLLPHGFSR